MIKNQRGFGLVEMLIVAFVVFGLYYFATRGVNTGKSSLPIGLASDVLTNPAANKKTIDAVENKLNRLSNKQIEQMNTYVETGEVESKPAGK